MQSISLCFPPSACRFLGWVELMGVNRDVHLVPCYCQSVPCVILPSGDHVSISLLSPFLRLGTLVPNQSKGTLLMMASGPDKRLKASHLNTFLLLLSAPSFHSTTNFSSVSVHLSFSTFPPSFPLLTTSASSRSAKLFLHGWITFGIKLFLTNCFLWKETGNKNTDIIQKSVCNPDLVAFKLF